jgi:hypothetical protein
LLTGFQIAPQPINEAAERLPGKTQSAQRTTRQTFSNSHKSLPLMMMITTNNLTIDLFESATVVFETNMSPSELKFLLFFTLQHTGGQLTDKSSSSITERLQPRR